MRLVVFFITLILGIGVGSIFKTVEKKTSCFDMSHHPITTSYSGHDLDAKSRNYTEEEALQLVGKRVRNLSGLNAKCPTEAGNCLELKVGEMGEVVDILRSTHNTYLIVIEWDSLTSDYKIKHTGNFVTRAGKEISFKIID